MRSITSGQIYRLFSLHLITTMTAFMLGTMLAESSYNGPLGTVLGAVFGLLIAFPAYKLGKRRPGKFFSMYGSEIVGKWLHTVLILFMISANLLIAIVNFWEMADFLVEFYLSTTPVWVITAMCGLCIGYTARSGAIVIFRAAEGVFFISLISFFLIPLFVSSNFDVHTARAFITHFSMAEAWPAAYYSMSIYGEMSFIIFVFPYLASSSRTFRSMFWAGLTSAIVVLCHILPLLFIFGPDLSANLAYPDLEMVRYMRSGSFLETLDPALIALWLVSIFVKISFVLFVASLALTHLLGLKDNKPFVFPLTALIGILSLILASSNVQFNKFMKGGLLTLLITAELVPLLYLIVDALRRSWSKPKGSEAR